MVEPFMPRSSSSTVGIGKSSLTMAPLARLISRQSWTSFPGFGTITTGFTRGVGPFTGSMMLKLEYSLILNSTAPRRLNGMCLSGWATGVTSGLMCRLTCLVFSFPTPLRILLLERLLKVRDASNVGTYFQDPQSHCCLFSQQRFTTFPELNMFSFQLSPIDM